MKKIIIFITLLLIIIFLLFGGFIYNLSKNTASETSKSITNQSNNYQYNHFKYNFNLISTDLTNCNGFLYKKLNNYDEYLSYKEKINSILDINKTQFENYFLLIIITERTKNLGFDLESISNDNNILKINLSTNKEIVDNGISILIPKNMDMTKIEIENIIKDMKISSYSDIKGISKDYSVEQATIDNCLVINQTIKKVYNKEKLNSFIESVNNKKADNIRIYQLIANGTILITDIEYTPENQFYICYDYTRYNHDLTYEYQRLYCDNIEISHTDSVGTKLTLYRIFDNNNEFEFAIY